MTIAARGGVSLDYLPCRYGTSRLLFRGPQRPVDGGHVAVLGGTETYGKFVEHPYPDLLEPQIGRAVVNLGVVNAGVDAFLNDPAILPLARHASATVIELTGAQNLTNRFYAVHPRRNDRFLRATSMLKTLYRDVDFTEFHFTRHLLAGLRDASPDKFALITAELKAVWVARMKRLIAQVGQPVVLLWLADHRPAAVADDPMERGGPLFVDAAMVEALRGTVADVVQVVADAEELRAGYAQMIFADVDAPAASELLGPAVHRRVARLLAETLTRDADGRRRTG